MPKISFPTERPDSAESTMWQLQWTLLVYAEGLLGPRDYGKKIYQPSFSDKGPRIINSRNCDGAYAELSRNAAGYWPTAVYELAHESVHLLNPIEGYSNYLEEGVAVAFSIEMSNRLTDHPMSPLETSEYYRAFELVELLPIKWNLAAIALREKAGSLSAVKFESLREFFPSVDESAIRKLVSTCMPR